MYALLTMRSGLKTPMAEIPTPDFAVPYAAPKQVKTMAEVHPIAPKNGCKYGQQRKPVTYLLYTRLQVGGFIRAGAGCIRETVKA